MAPKRVRTLPWPGAQQASKAKEEHAPVRKRFLAFPPGTRLPKPSPVAKARSQRLVASTDLRESLKEEKLSCEKLPETDADLLRIEKRVELDKWATREKGGEESSGSSSSESEAAKTGGIKTKQRNLAARTKRRRMKYLEVKMEDIADRLSPLEEGNLLKEVRRSYGNYLLKLTDMVEKGNHAFKTEHEVDLCMALCFNQQFLEGESSHVGEKIMASWVDQNPDYGNYGRKKLPRSWRCLKGWRKMCPGRSRLGHALPVWAGSLWRMIARGPLQSNFGAPQPEHLLQAWSAPSTQEILPRPPEHWDHWCMVLAAFPVGVLRNVEGGCSGRLSAFGQQLHSVPEPAAGGAGERRRPNRTGLDFRLPRVPGSLQTSDKGLGLECGSLRGKAQRAIHRQGQKLENSRGCQEEGHVGGSVERGKVRKASQVGGQLEQAKPRTKDDLQPGRNLHAGDLPRAGTSRNSSAKTARPKVVENHQAGKCYKSEYLADFFSGSGRLSRAARKAGFTAREFDIDNCPPADLTSPGELSLIRRDIMIG